MGVGPTSLHSTKPCSSGHHPEMVIVHVGTIAWRRIIAVQRSNPCLFLERAFCSLDILLLVSRLRVDLLSGRLRLRSAERVRVGETERESEGERDGRRKMCSPKEGEITAAAGRTDKRGPAKESLGALQRHIVLVRVAVEVVWSKDVLLSAGTCNQL